jgi:hypothetical protein
VTEWLVESLKLAAVWIVAALLFGVVAGSLMRAGDTGPLPFKDAPDEKEDADDA